MQNLDSLLRAIAQKKLENNRTVSHMYPCAHGRVSTFMWLCMQVPMAVYLHVMLLCIDVLMCSCDLAVYPCTGFDYAP